MLKTLLGAAAMVCVTVPAVAQSYGGRDEPCLRNRNIHDYQVVPGERSLVVRDIARQRYRINFLGRCYGLKHNMGLAFRSRGTSSLSCVARGDIVYNTAGIGTDRQCIVQSVEYQTRALDQRDYEALRARDDRPARRDRDYRDRDYR